MLTFNIAPGSDVMQTFFLKLLGAAMLVSLTGCGIFEQRDKTLDWSASQLYAEAKEEQQSGNFETAAKHLEKLEARYPFGTYAQQAQMDLAHIYYLQQEKQQALSTIDRFLKAYPNHRNADYMYYLRGLVYFGGSNSIFNFLGSQDMTERDPQAVRDAFDAFKMQVERFPDSKYNEDAILRMRYLLNSMSTYELHVAKYYMRRGAYLSAAKRAQGIISEYPDSHATAQALSILVSAYDALGEKTLRDDTARIYQKNFPEGAPALEDNKSWWKIWE